MSKKSVCIIFGGKSEEYEVSLRSCYSVLENINTDKYEITKIGITRDGKWFKFLGKNEDILNDTWQKNTEPIKINFSTGCVDNSEKIDVVLPVMHGTFCEDGRLQGIFESLGIKYVGCDSFSSFLCMDKELTKMVAKSVNVPVVPSICIRNRTDFPKKIAYPAFIKPCLSGSSRGAGKVNSFSQLQSALDNAFLYSHKVLIEEFIECTECEIGVLEAARGDIIFSEVGSLNYNSDFYDYNTKYISNGTTYSIPAKIPTYVSNKIKEYAKILFNALGCKGLARLDFFVTKDNKIYFNEINTLPGFTSISMYPMLFKNLGYSFTEIIDILVNF